MGKTWQDLTRVDTAWLRLEGHPTNLMMSSGLLLFDQPLTLQDVEWKRKTLSGGLGARYLGALTEAGRAACPGPGLGPVGAGGGTTSYGRPCRGRHDPLDVFLQAADGPCQLVDLRPEPPLELVGRECRLRGRLGNRTAFCRPTTRTVMPSSRGPVAGASVELELATMQRLGARPNSGPS